MKKSGAKDQNKGQIRQKARELLRDPGPFDFKESDQ